MADDPQKQAGIRYRQSKLEALRRISAIENRSVTELVDMALADWLKAYGPIPAEPKRKLEGKG